MNLNNKINNLKGPILVIGASGFIGANLMRQLLTGRDDVIGTVFSGDTWRLRGIPSTNVYFLNLQDPISVKALLEKIGAQTIFDCSSFGAYSFENDYERIHKTNYLSLISLMEEVSQREITAYIHAGSSSEYGLNTAQPDENDPLVPNSHYAVSKAAASHCITYYGKVRHMPVINLRLYSVYGPYEDSSRLIPILCEQSMNGRFPPFADAETCRDFIHVDDVIDAFVSAALKMSESLFGESFNIGTGTPTTLKELAQIAANIFSIKECPVFNPQIGRAWDLSHWYAKIDKAEKLLDWKASTTLETGLKETRKWWQDYLLYADFSKLTKRDELTCDKKSITAVIACYHDEKAIPIMYERLVKVFLELGMDYQIVFVNDNSPDNSFEVIRQISATDPNVLGINHSRNFGSQAAFRSGMEMASKEACVLLDGDLQDPPELIKEFVTHWHNGADVVYGRRVKREMSRALETCYRGFYRLFASLSEVPIAKDAGDFSLLDRNVVHWILQCKERDSFLRGLRAYVGFNQVGVDYVRPERMFGVSTNNWIKNIGWAKKAIFSFSRVPLHLLTAFGGICCCGTVSLALFTILYRVFFPEKIPHGITFMSLLIMFFGSASIFGLGLLGEYIGKILEETKARPPFIRRSLILHGKEQATMYLHRDG